MARALVLLCLLGMAAPAAAQDELSRVVEIEFHPVRRAQIAVWLEGADGTFVRTLGLTQAVAYRGIGNRPGASQMNSGFLWPYGRREGVLPVWAHRRASAPGARQFSRVIFQDRSSEGWASRSTADHSTDDYFCLSFNQSASEMDALDAVTCPSLFNSDKGRYLTESDGGYAEPFEARPGAGSMRVLSLTSLYPPRRDVTRCAGTGCFDHADVALFAADARRVMPEIDAVTMATPPEGEHRMMFTVPPEWPNGEYVLYVEVNTEGDYNGAWGPAQYPTPLAPANSWDFWAMEYGYPYRGQPSVVYRVPFTLSNGATVASAREPAGYGSLEGSDGELRDMDGSISEEPSSLPGSGADRLRLDGRDYRVRVQVIGPEVCQQNGVPGAITALAVTEFRDRRQAHRYAHLSFVAPSDDFGVARYDVRVSREPIVDEGSFERALQARAATLENEALVILPQPAGAHVEAELGGLAPEQRFFIGVRAVDLCNVAGPIAVVEHTPPQIEFTTVSPCFVATAAYGTPMARDISALRRLRDRHLRTNGVGRAVVAAYERVGPHLAAAVRDDEERRAAARAALAPFVALARWLE